MSMMSQTRQIREHLESGRSITPREALRLYGCFRLGARIWDLRDAGLDIETTIVAEGGKHFASYRLV